MSRAGSTATPSPRATPASTAAGCTSRPDADIADGLIEIVSYGDLPKWRFLRGLARVFRGTHLRDPAVELVQAREVHVDAGRPFRIYADGDPVGMTPATIRAVPRALRVLAP